MKPHPVKVTRRMRRIALELKHEHDLTYGQIAARFGISEATAHEIINGRRRPRRLKLLAACLLLLFCPLARAQKELPDAPKPNDKKIFIIGTAALAAAKSYDAITTQQLLNRGGVEMDPLFGRHPSSARIAGINAAMFGAESFAFYLTEHSHKRWIRWLGRGYISYSIADHIRAGVCNSGIHPPSNQSCGL